MPAHLIFTQPWFYQRLSVPHLNSTMRVKDISNEAEMSVHPCARVGVRAKFSVDGKNEVWLGW